MNMLRKVLFITSTVYLAGCGKGKDDDKAAGGKSYEFSAGSSVTIQSSSLNLNTKSISDRRRSTLLNENLCTDDQPNLTCVAPTSLTGIYYGVGLLIQANGSGMLAYMLNDEWSSIDADSESYEFDAANPTVTSGDLVCCGGTGNLTGENVYFSNVSYVFGYLDATFTIPFSTEQLATVSDQMEAAHTVRFVLVDDAIEGYVRGDLLYKDDDETFKWSDADGNLTATRPEAPITMNSKVVDWENPFEGGSDDIPVIYTEINDDENGKIVTSEEELEEEGKTYSFDFDTTYLVALMIGQDSLSQLQTRKDLLEIMHLQGLPHTDFTFGTSGTSTLTIE